MQCMQSALRWLQQVHRSGCTTRAALSPYVFWMTQPKPIAAVAPVEPFLTGYDMDHLVTYLRLLDADADEGAISKQADRPYGPGDRGIWVKSKCLNREEFVVVGWTDPEGSRSHLGALLLGYYTDDGRLHYAGRAGTGMTEKELKRLAGVLKPLQVSKMPLAEPPPRDSRFGSPLKLARVHWVRPELVVEVTYLTWTEDNLLRQVSYQGQREDKPAGKWCGRFHTSDVFASKILSLR
jgi:ATP-dependent DNA ligase